MASLSGPGVLARLAELSREASEDQGGALWRLAAGGRQLDANLVRLLPDTHVAEHVEPALDVLLYVTAGSGQLRVDGMWQDLTEGSVVWLPRGTRRALHAGPDGLIQLSVHRRRPGLAIRTPATGAEEEGGERACLLDRVCAECGRLASESDARYCSRCGERLPDSV
ncbi:AraC family ligand binding domain-containing protein [Streptomyces sp. NPDC019396]|uniref:AraC family ligand binding domain-containing protein n=1 Tax=Streptomyces sp. NPDC019396 TaxID=3154687 RepID=UPI00340753C2